MVACYSESEIRHRSPEYIGPQLPWRAPGQPMVGLRARFLKSGVVGLCWREQREEIRGGPGDECVSSPECKHTHLRRPSIWPMWGQSLQTTPHFGQTRCCCCWARFLKHSCPAIQMQILSRVPFFAVNHTVETSFYFVRFSTARFSVFLFM